MKRLFELSTSWHRLPQFVPIVAAAVIGVGVSISAWLTVSLREDRLAELEFSARAKSHALSLQTGIDDYSDRIVALRALFEASDEVTRKEFDRFTDRILREQTAILRATWIPRIRREERVAHELEAAREGLTGYRIHDLAPEGIPAPSQERDEYFPVFYATRASKTSDVYGLDIGSEPMRRRTLERARDGDKMATASKIVLHTATEDRHGFFVLLPVYRQGQPHDTLEERRGNLIGFVNGVFQTGVMIESILDTKTIAGGLDLYFFAADAGRDAAPFYFHASRTRAAPIEAQSRAALAAGLHWSTEIAVGDGRWTLVAAPSPGGPGTASHRGAWLVLIAGMLVSGMVVAYMWASVRYAHRLEVANKTLDRTLGELETQNTRFDAALNNMSEGLCMFDGEQKLLVSNARYARMYGLSPEQVMPGNTLREIAEKRTANGVYAGEIPQEYASKLLTIAAENTPTTRVQELNDGRVIALKYQPMPNGGWVATHEDVTEQRNIQARIAYMAHHDALTDLPNRVLVCERLREAISRAPRQEGVALLCLDLDRFKEVNDTMGHPAGDGLLKSVAERLRSCVRETDTVARLGGDEFAIVQIALNQPMDATALATRIIDAISAPHDLNGQEVVVGASIGIALSPGDGSDPDQLMRSADLALYRAKSDGRGTYRFFERGMDERMQARRNLERDLRTALVNGELELHYQPIVELAHNEVAGFEALLRWNHPERGRVSPADFIPLAEETGLIVPIGEWVLRQACADAAAWPTHIKVAVNLSPVQFKNRNLVDVVASALTASGLAAGRLELEITESVLLQESVRTLAILHELRALGVRISMDDFGTGYSSLSYLRSFPFDKIKIDQSFIRDINENDQSLAIVHAVAGLGVSLGMTTTAEGVETKEQLDRVRAEGCSEVQGYYFSRPKPAGEVATLLSTTLPRSELAA